MIQLSTSAFDPAIAVFPHAQDEGTVDSTVEYTLNPTSRGERFDAQAYEERLNAGKPPHFTEFLVHDYTDEEWPVVVVEVWKFCLNPDDYTDEELYDHLADVTGWINNVDTSRFVSKGLGD